MRKGIQIPVLLVLAAGLFSAQRSMGGYSDFDGADYEEPAGPSFTVLAGPEGGVYGGSFEEGMWVKGTPIFGNFSLSLFKNDIEDSLYSGISLTIRILPRWKLAPFVGAGGSFNYSWSSGSIMDGSSGIPAVVVADAAARGGDSYWGGHVEAGARMWLDSGIKLIEAFGRYTWSSSGPDCDYWLIGVSTGLGW